MPEKIAGAFFLGVQLEGQRTEAFQKIEGRVILMSRLLVRRQNGWNIKMMFGKLLREKRGVLFGVLPEPVQPTLNGLDARPCKT